MHPAILLHTVNIEHDLRVRAALRRRILRRMRPARRAWRVRPVTSPVLSG